MSRRICLWLFISTFATPLNSVASVQIPSPRPQRVILTERERQPWKAPSRSAQFSDIPNVRARSRCPDPRPPQALATPDPLLLSVEAGMKVKVSFIIGADGLVGSPLILQSAGLARDRNVLRTVRSWRYRPATCNGVPTEAEARIEFSRR